MTAVADEIQIDEAVLRGNVVRPGAQEYDVHRKIWNGAFDKHPAVIVRCAGVSDVIAAVKFGRASGLPVAVALGSIAQIPLVEIEPTDPLTMITITVVLSAVALTACVVPARKAARVDPMIALRSE